MEDKMNKMRAIKILVVFIFLVSAGLSTALEPGAISGKYSWEMDGNSAELVVDLLPDGKIHVKGLSLSGAKQNTDSVAGEFDFSAPIVNGRVEYSEKGGMGMFYKLELMFTGKGLYVKEEGISKRIGMHAKFGGEYSKN